MERNRGAEMCMCGIDEQGIKDTTKGRKASGKTTQRNKTLTAGTRNNLPQCQLWPLLILLLLLLLLLPIRHIRISPHRAHIRHRGGYGASAHRRHHRRRAPILSLLTRRILIPSIRIVPRIRIRMRSSSPSTSTSPVQAQDQSRERQGQGIRHILGHLPVWLVHRLSYCSRHQHPRRWTLRSLYLHVHRECFFSYPSRDPALPALRARFSRLEKASTACRA